VSGPHLRLRIKLLKVLGFSQIIFAQDAHTKHSRDSVTRVHRCKSRQIFGGAKEFFLDSPKLAREILQKSDLQKKLLLSIQALCDLQKLFVSIRALLFSNQSMLSAFFALIFVEFYKVLKDFSRILGNFSWILRDFSRIFTKSNLLRVRLRPCTPAS